MEQRAHHVIYEFGEFRLDPLQRQLHRGNAPVALTGRAFDALLYFVEHRGELLDKSVLMKALWPHVIVEEGNLSQTVHTLRRVLGEQRLLVTVPGRGYQFVADVRTSGRIEQPRRTRWAAIASMAGLLVAVVGIAIWFWSRPAPTEARASIAVLPLTNMTADPAQEYFVDGLTEELITTLASISGIEVSARSSVFAYKGKRTDIRQVGRELGVTHVLEGSLRTSGEQMRLSAQLIDAHTGNNVWAQTYDRKLADIFKVQDELAISVVHALAPHIRGGKFPGTMRTHPTQDVEAYRLWLQATEYEPTEENLRRAVVLLREATRRDPQFASAWVVMAGMYAQSLSFGYQLPGALTEFESAATRAYELAPDSSEADFAKFLLHLARGNWLEASEHSRGTLVKFASPTKRSSQAMDLMAGIGRVRDALSVVEEQQKAAPREPGILMQLAVLNAMLNRDAEALRCLDLARALGVPEDLPPMHAIRSAAAVHAGDYAEGARRAAAGLPAGLRIAGSDELLTRVFRGVTDPSQKVAAVAAVKPFVDAIDANTQHTYPYAMLIYVMTWYTRLGALDRAYELADRWIDHYKQAGLVGVPFTIFLWSEDMRPFRADARFHDFATQLGYMEIWQRDGLPDGCSMRAAKLVCR